MQRLERVDLAEFLTLTPSAFLYRSPTENKPLILVVKFAGLYRSGSLGSPDASFIGAVRTAALHRYLPDGLVLDFSELDYTWGDDMDNLLPGPDEAVYFWWHTPMAIVVGPDCREAIRTLTFGLNSDTPLERAIWAKLSLEDALAFVEPRAIQRKRRK